MISIAGSRLLFVGVCLVSIAACDGCCQQGGCSGSTCCKCPRNGLNFCVQPSFGCGGCS